MYSEKSGKEEEVKGLLAEDSSTTSVTLEFTEDDLRLERQVEGVEEKQKEQLNQKLAEDKDKAKKDRLESILDWVGETVTFLAMVPQGALAGLFGDQGAQAFLKWIEAFVGELHPGVKIAIRISTTGAIGVAGEEGKRRLVRYYNTSTFKDLANIQGVDFSRKFKAVINPTGCELHSMTSLPKNLQNYKYAYIFIEISKQLYYIRSNGVAELVNITDLDTFNTAFAGIMQNKKFQRLTPQQVNTLVTLNGDHRPEGWSYKCIMESTKTGVTTVVNGAFTGVASGVFGGLAYIGLDTMAGLLRVYNLPFTNALADVLGHWWVKAPFMTASILANLLSFPPIHRYAVQEIKDILKYIKENPEFRRGKEDIELSLELARRLWMYSIKHEQYDVTAKILTGLAENYELETKLLANVLKLLFLVKHKEKLEKKYDKAMDQNKSELDEVLWQSIAQVKTEIVNLNTAVETALEECNDPTTRSLATQTIAALEVKEQRQVDPETSENALNASIKSLSEKFVQKLEANMMRLRNNLLILAKDEAIVDEIFTGAQCGDGCKRPKPQSDFEFLITRFLVPAGAFVSTVYGFNNFFDITKKLLAMIGVGIVVGTIAGGMDYMSMTALALITTRWTSRFAELLFKRDPVLQVLPLRTRLWIYFQVVSMCGLGGFPNAEQAVIIGQDTYTVTDSVAASFLAEAGSYHNLTKGNAMKKFVWKKTFEAFFKKVDDIILKTKDLTGLTDEELINLYNQLDEKVKRIELEEPADVEEETSEAARHFSHANLTWKDFKREATSRIFYFCYHMIWRETEGNKNNRPTAEHNSHLSDVASPSNPTPHPGRLTT